jgi:hypothetical protein
MQVQGRVAKCDAIVGAVGTGKTTFLRESVVMPMVAAGHRALIVTPDAKEWSDIEILTSYEDIATFTGIKRMIYKDGRLEKIREYYSNGVLVFDDCRLYINAQSDDFMRWLQIRRRHQGIDLFSVFHSLAQIPPIYFTFISNLVLFHSLGNIKKRTNEIDDYILQEVAKAKAEILNEVEKGNKYAKKLISFDKRF